jgi:hypothetical protein
MSTNDLMEPKGHLMFDNWAQPVTSKPWALVAKIVWRIQWATGHRLDGRYAHRAWQRATR